MVTPVDGSELAREEVGRKTPSKIPSSTPISVSFWARADLCLRLGRAAEAGASYERALALTQQEPGAAFP